MKQMNGLSTFVAGLLCLGELVRPAKDVKKKTQ
jgi:hypothetical protein